MLRSLLVGVALSACAPSNAQRPILSSDPSNPAAVEAPPRPGSTTLDSARATVTQPATTLPSATQPATTPPSPTQPATTLPSVKKPLYACPMHPEVTSDKPGQTCPKCGMTLVLPKGGMKMDSVPPGKP